MSTPDSDSPASPAAPVAPPAPARRRWARRLAAGLGFVLGAALVGAVAVATWAVITEAGARAVAARLPASLGVVVEPRGRLMGGEFGARRIELALPGGYRLVIDEPAWRNAALHWQHDAPWRARLSLAQLSAQRITLLEPATPPPTTARQPPDGLASPIGVDIEQVQIDQLHAPGLGDDGVRDLRLGLHLGAGSRATHRVTGASLQWDRLQARGQADIDARAPMRLAARIELAARAVAQAGGAGTAPPGPAAAPGEHGFELPADWNATVEATGPLEHLVLTATVRAHEQALDGNAQLQPFAAQPVTRLQLRAKGFDVAPFVRGAPQTALTGDVLLQLAPPVADAQTVQLTATLSNARATRWGSGGVPLRRLELAVLADARALARGTVQSLRMDLGTAAQAAGRVSGSGSWERPGTGGPLLRIEGKTQLDDLLPAQIDPRAPAMQLSGPVQWSVLWPRDAPPGAGSPAVAPGAGDPAAGPAVAGAGPAAARPVLQSLEARLTGRALALPGTPPLTLDLAASGDASAFTIQRFDARAGSARAVVSGQARQRGEERWQVVGDLALTAFDPALWWPAGTASAWRRGPHRLSGELHLDLDVPVGLARRHGQRALDTLAATRGQAELSLRDSQLAGVPLSGTVSLRASGKEPAAGVARLRSGASELTLEARLDAHGNGAGDRWQLQWRAAALEAFAPLLRLAQAADALPVPTGDSTGTLAVAGRWPQAGLNGQLRSNRLQVQGVTLQGAEAGWSLQGEAGAVELQVKAERLQLAGQAPAVQAATLRVAGTAGAHTVLLDAEITGLAPGGSTPATAGGVVASISVAPRLPRRLHATLRAAGRWTRSSAGASAWAGNIEETVLRDPDARPGVPPWLQMAGAPLSAAQGPAGLSLQMGDARVAVAGAVLHVQRAQWQRDAQGKVAMDTRITLEALAVAPLLARLQPDFGWSGDLKVAGHAELKSGAGTGVEADVELARTEGDLQVLEPDSPDGPQRLGLTGLRVALQARGGTWQLQQHMEGRNLGRLEGSQTVRTSAQTWWPAADAPLTGQIDLRVDNLGAWSLWLPAGWRLTGALATQARIGGRFGAPQFTGDLTGRNMGMHNIVQGVDWRDASLRVALQGAGARIESFTARAGDGTVSGTGELRLGEVPRLQLNVQADKFAALQRVDRRIVVSGTADLVGEPRSIVLNGRLRIDQGRIDVSQSDAPSLDDDVAVRRGPEDDAAAANGNRGRRDAERRIALDVQIDLGDALVLRGRGVDTRLAGELRITSPANKLAMHGTVRAVDGTYAAYAQKLSIDRGLIVFTGTPNNPRLDIEATRPNTEEVRVGVAITGTAQNPRVRLFSDPEMSDTDKLSWLVLGRASEGLGRTDLALLQRAAYALLSGESEAPSIVEMVGLDELSVRQDDSTSSDGTVRETVVSLGKQLSRRWYVGYERSLNAVAGTWQLVYRAAQRFTLRAQTGAQNSLDMIWTWQWE
jgi:translocation and assembly module TamB